MEYPHDHSLPKSAPGASLLGLGVPGVTYFLKELGVPIPTWVVWIVGIVSTLALLLAAFQFFAWLWQYRHHPRILVDRITPAKMILSGLTIIGVGFLIGATLIGLGIWRQAPAVANAAPQPSASSPILNFRTLSDDERRDRRDALQALLALVRGPLREPLTAAQVINSSLEKSTLENPTSLAQLAYAQQKAAGKLAADLNDLLRANAGMPDITEFTDWKLPVIPWESIGSRINTFPMMFHRETDEQMKAYYSRQFLNVSAELKAWRDALQQYEQWINQKVDAIAQKQRAIASPTYQVEVK